MCPDLELVTEGDTDPRTFKEIQRTLAEVRGKFEPEARRETPLDAKSAPKPSARREQRSGRHREVDAESLVEALDFIDKAVADSGDTADRMNRAVEAARQRLALDRVM